jgi:5-amino-6-(5-phospho-D-ribitylamino)uracil phosphatase
MLESNKTPEIKLIALDMDGTLLNSNGEVSAENRAAIKEAKEKGIQIILSTGRSRLSCSEYAKSLQLNSYLVTVNGSEIWGPTGELVQRNKVDAELIQWMWELSKTHSTKFWAIGCEGVWHNEMPDNLLDINWLKFGFEIDDDAIRENIKNSLSEKGSFEVTNSSLTNLEVNALGINKAMGIKAVCDILDISMENVMACGDSLNDIAMIKECGWGVAMGNAQEIIKQTANAVTDDHNEDGVAKAIRKWALNSVEVH